MTKSKSITKSAKLNVALYPSWKEGLQKVAEKEEFRDVTELVTEAIEDIFKKYKYKPSRISKNGGGAAT